MKVDERHLTERSGVAEVQLRVTTQLKWLFREQPTSDFGIDAQIEVVQGFQATGRLLAAQIKHGLNRLIHGYSHPGLPPPGPPKS